MRRAAALIALLLPVAACGGTSHGGGAADMAASHGDAAPATGGGGSESSAVSGITAAHNAARAAVMPAPTTPIPPLTYDDTVAATAQAWANGCQFEHSGGPYGENIYASTNPSDAQQVVAAWVGESADYDYAANSCSSVCGHYTQVVWAASLRLGCGVANCTDNGPFGGGDWQLWVCNYDPPGNYDGQRPY